MKTKLLVFYLFVNVVFSAKAQTASINYATDGKYSGTPVTSINVNFTTLASSACIVSATAIQEVLGVGYFKFETASRKYLAADASNSVVFLNKATAAQAPAYIYLPVMSNGVGTITLDARTTATNVIPITVEYSSNGGAWTTLSGKETISILGNNTSNPPTPLVYNLAGNIQLRFAYSPATANIWIAVKSIQVSSFATPSYDSNGTFAGTPVTSININFNSLAAGACTWSASIQETLGVGYIKFKTASLAFPTGTAISVFNQSTTGGEEGTEIAPAYIYLPTMSNGVQSLSVWAYTVSGTESIGVEYSKNGGASWLASGNIAIGNTASLPALPLNVNVTGSVQLRLKYVGTNSLMIRSIMANGYDATANYSYDGKYSGTSVSTLNVDFNGLTSGATFSTNIKEVTLSSVNVGFVKFKYNTRKYIYTDASNTVVFQQDGYNGQAPAYIYLPTMNNGVGTITLDARTTGATGTTTIGVEYSLNGGAWTTLTGKGTITLPAVGDVSNTPPAAATPLAYNLAGNVQLRFKYVPAVGANTFIAVKSVQITPYTPATVSSSTNISSLSGNESEINVTNGATLTIDANIAGKAITAAPGAKVTLADTKTLSGTLTLESDASGTATFVDNYATPTVTAIVKQHVTAGRNWYMSAPLNTANSAVLNRGTSVVEYNETTGLWPIISSGTLTPGKGYIQVASSTEGSAGTVIFSGTTNSGIIPVTLTYNSGTGKGFNLVGNPYPSYLNWQAVAADNTAANMPTGTMWYRTINYNGKSAWVANHAYSLNDIVYNGTRFYKVTTAGTSAALDGPSGTASNIADNSVVWAYEGSIYIFATVNADGQVSPSSVSNLVPPMQAFWVKSTGGTLTFKNAMRSHNTGGSNVLKAPKSTANEIPLVRLSVTNGTSADEAVIYASANASNTFDSYDAPKYFNTASSNQPEIFTQVGNEKLAINALNELNDRTELPLGFATAKGNNFSIATTELKNLGSNLQVILKDKQSNNAEFNLTNGQAYNFSSSAVNDANRFSLILRAPGVTTDIEKASLQNTQVFVNAANQITINAPEKSNYSIYNTLGQLIENGILNVELQTANCKLETGIYLVKVNNQSRRVILK